MDQLRAYLKARFVDALRLGIAAGATVRLGPISRLEGALGRPQARQRCGGDADPCRRLA